MRTRRVSYILVGAVILGAALATVAASTTQRDREIRLVTPPLFVEGAFVFSCTATNHHASPVTMDIKVYDQTGTRACGIGPQVVQPGQAVVQECNSDINLEFQPIRYCEILYTGRSGRVLGTAQFDTPSKGNLGVGPAVQAVEVP